MHAQVASRSSVEHNGGMRPSAEADRLATTHCGDSGVLERVCEVTELLGELPAVATLDWCDRAADALLAIGNLSAALVMISRVDEMGRVTGHEAVGTATSRVDRAHLPVRAQAVRSSEVADDEGLRDRLRSKAERLGALGWVPGPAGLSRLTVGVVSSLPGGRSWAMGALGRLWAGHTAVDPIVGMSPLGGVEAGRVLTVMLGKQSGAWTDGAELLILKAVLHVLVRRALLAIGPARSSASNWLTAREQAILERLILGRSVREIAGELDRSPHTVHDHVKSLHRKLNANSRGELIARALGHLADPPAKLRFAPTPDAHASVEAKPLPGDAREAMVLPTERGEEAPRP